MCLTITNLSKTYGGVAALDKVNLTLQPAIYGLVGRNGAGKSTLMGIIANRLLPSGGTVALDGANVRENESAQGRIYLVDETVPFMMGVRVSTIFRREGRYYGGFDWGFSSRMLAEFGILPGVMYGALSLGQRMIVRLVAALCVPVDVLLLDEPVIGLDAANRQLFYRFLLESYNDRPRTIVVSTHIIDEIAHVVERVAILDRGRIVDEFTAESVGSRATALVGDAERVMRFVEECGLRVISREDMGRLATVTVRGGIDANDLPEGIVASGLGLQEYVIRATAVGGDDPRVEEGSK
ncbi:ATP-binding cassette domain-containing protein [Bifidobacterium scardovii]|uniref:ABC transporter n=1 Tax=Bifidobacterium scardovii TaxID=158787 RepID=A0A087D7F8_9BIFI|nr:ABC transporter ATP-binding protein [Bifidobacterium scardovii]KFI91458.1 ABC transporter [Bifidobacterium scardovii]MDK6349506.1 ABC transporter ATP-binding protein [Bifidobacterium scardovii]MDU8982629.1 ABC transporter ATP-binding protein [Bifidobacterium scardovii]BAQ30777.1 ABC transporter ATP-binding component [Bifidobacterium scardovii JCM 12489 = DSM 13734]